MRQTRIVATVGPASSGDAMLRGLIDAGVDVFRFNFSHGTHESHGEIIGRLRTAAAAAGRVVAILQDLSGPKIRTGPLEGGTPIVLRPGAPLTIAVGDFAGRPGRISTTFAGLPAAVHPGDTLLLDDGRMSLRVNASERGALQTVVVDGGALGEHKGINAPGVELPAEGLTPKDAEDLRFGVSAGVDFIALSFVQSARDIQRAREALRAANAPGLPIVAKLERPQAVTRLEEILLASDAVMVARGDLGLELPLERVPRVQKEITRRARALGLPVIVATQVFESMRTEPRPTRAEVSDAANAVDDGVDAIMLAGETAVGAHPVRTVQTLDLVIRDAELMPPLRMPSPDELRLLPAHGLAICEAAVTLADRSSAAAILAITRGGKTARVLSALRPRVPIYAATHREEVARRLALSWGVLPVVADLSGGAADAAARVADGLVARGALAGTSSIVVVSVTPDLAPGPSNFLKLQQIHAAS